MTDEYPPAVGGVGISVRRIARALKGEEFSMSVAVLEDSAEPPLMVEEDDHGVSITRFRNGETGRHRPQELAAEMLMRFRNWAAQGDYDLYHAFFPTRCGMPAGIAARLACRPFLASFRGNDLYQGIFGRHLQTLRWVMAHADLVTFVNSEMARLAAAVEPACRAWEVVRNGVDIPHEAKRPEVRSSGEPVVVGTTGVLRSKKGLETLLKACGAVARRRPIRLLFVGTIAEAERDHYLARIAEEGLADITEITGLVPRQEVLQQLERMDLFLFPALYDGCPNSLLEAAAYGLPVIRSDAESLAEILDAGTECLVHATEDWQEMARCIEMLADATDLRACLGAAAREKIRNAFPLVQERETWQRIYRSLMASNRSGG